MKKILFLGLFLVFTSALACINHYYTTDAHGETHNSDLFDYERKLNKNFNLKLISQKLDEIQIKLIENGDFRDLSDYAALLMKAGKEEVALEILRELSNYYPDEFRIASNLGTAYELNGEVDSALVYIGKAMVLNPNDHEGSEWFHIRILETKNELKRDSTYLERHTALRLTDEEKGQDTIREHIWIQVKERFPFTPGPDAIMGSVMIEMADCYAQTYSVELAQVFYRTARDYYGFKEDLCSQRIEEMEELINEANQKDPPKANPPYIQNMGKVSYTRMFDDFSDQNFEINWSEFELNVDTLLNWVGLERANPQPIAETSDEEPAAVETNQETSATDNSLIYILLGILILGGLIFIVIRRKNLGS